MRLSHTSCLATFTFAAIFSVTLRAAEAIPARHRGLRAVWANNPRLTSLPVLKVGQYLTFLRFCRTGQTLAYAAPWAEAWGRHGGKIDPRWCGPEPWNYWRLLSELNCGVSFLAIYGADRALHSIEITR